jgi:hypothetical protein
MATARHAAARSDALPRKRIRRAKKESRCPTLSRTSSRAASAIATGRFDLFVEAHALLGHDALLRDDRIAVQRDFVLLFGQLESHRPCRSSRRQSRWPFCCARRLPDRRA